MRRAATSLTAALTALCVSACDVPPDGTASRAQASPPAAASETAAGRPARTPTENASLKTRTAAAGNQTNPEPWLWLEEIDGTRALQWVLKHNRNTRAVLEHDPRFKPFREESLTLLTAPDRVPFGSFMNGFVYNFWQDATHPRGIWRRTTLKSYRSESPEWETLLDIDRIAAAESENWVLKGLNCLAPDYERCLVALSRGGRDRFVLREWSITERAFVEGGFSLPESYSEVSWLDRDTLLISSPVGRNALSALMFGARDEIRKWKRGTRPDQAVTIFRARTGDKSVTPVVVHRPEGPLTLIARRLNFYDTKFVVLRKDGSPAELPLPSFADLGGVFRHQLLFVLSKSWTLPGKDGGTRTIPQGTLISFDLEVFLKTGKRPQIETVYVPDSRSAFRQISMTRDSIVLGLLRNVASEMMILRRKNGEWHMSPAAIPKHGTATLLSSGLFSNVAFVAYENDLTPPGLFQLDTETGEVELLKSLPDRFKADGLSVERHEATSRDGTKVPYTLIMPEGAQRDGTQSVLLYGYGGFGVPLTPQYRSGIGKLWLEKGGAFAVANIRGGGEFGPRWHQAAIRTRRQRGFDDFIAVAEDLIARKVSSPRRLGIMGGSNGGLLVGAAFTQRPDLFNAVVCQVPLLDMLRYTKLPPGQIWISEYGDPADPAERRELLRYSPYHNVREDADYPKVFFLTSTDDDRVHPGHARKMVARMEAMGHDVFYYEYLEGGHSSSASLFQRADVQAMQFVYLTRRLMDKKTIEETAQNADKGGSASGGGG